MKICIIKLSAMGDIIHAMIALQFIKKEIPNSTIDWIVEDAFKGILQNNPDIDNILPVNLKSIKNSISNIIPQYKLLKSYSNNDYDLIIDAQGLIKSAIVSRLIGAKKIVGFDKNSIRESISAIAYQSKVNIAYEANAIERNMKVLCEPLDIKYSKEMILQKNKFLYFDSNVHLKDEYIVFVIGASKENKIYPKKRFAELANTLKRKILVVWGNESEQSIAKWIAQHSDYVTVAPKGNLDDLKAIINSSQMVIGGDTGPTHIAWALNIPSITIFGNTPEYRNTYITEINRVIKSSSKVDALNLDYNDFSINEIDPIKIADLALEILN